MKNSLLLSEEHITTRLAHIHARLAWIAKREAEAAPFGGMGADGEFEPERDRLITEADQLLHRLEAMG